LAFFQYGTNKLAAKTVLICPTRVFAVNMGKLSKGYEKTPNRYPTSGKPEYVINVDRGIIRFFRFSSVGRWSLVVGRFFAVMVRFCYLQTWDKHDTICIQLNS